MNASQKMLFTREQVIKAINFHLCDEKWFPEVPKALNEWLEKHIDPKKQIGLRSDEWHENKSGTQRMLWLMIAAGLDPYELCKFAKDPQVMHRRFNNIIQSWGNE